MKDFISLITLISTVGFAVGLFNDSDLTNKFGAVALIGYISFLFLNEWQKMNKYKLSTKVAWLALPTQYLE